MVWNSNELPKKLEVLSALCDEVAKNLLMYIKEDQSDKDEKHTSEYKLRREKLETAAKQIIEIHKDITFCREPHLIKATSTGMVDYMKSMVVKLNHAWGQCNEAVVNLAAYLEEDNIKKAEKKLKPYQSLRAKLWATALQTNSMNKLIIECRVMIESRLIELENPTAKIDTDAELKRLLVELS